MKASFRVYLIAHAGGRFTAHLMPRWNGLFDPRPPAAYGISEEDVLEQLSAAARQAFDGDDELGRYLWREGFRTRTVRIEVHPLATARRRLVIGKRTVPLRMTYAWSPLRRGGYRVLLPRFGWSWVLEELDMAPQILRQEVGAVLAGEDSSWVFEFRRQAEESVVEWAPRWLRAPAPAAFDFDDAGEFETLHQVAEELVEQAFRRRLPAAVGDIDLDSHAALFDRDPPASLLLIGPPGVGKTTWIRRLATYFARRRRQGDRAVPRIWATSADRLTAGMIYLGQWEQRCLDLIEELAFEGDYLSIDHLPGLLREQTGRTSVGDLLLPALEAGEISLIAECTEAELEHCQRTAPSWLGHFQPIRLEATSARATAPLLETYLARQEKGIEIYPEGLRRLIYYLETFRRHEAFPGKAFRFVDWLVREHAGGGARMLDPEAVAAAFSRQTGLPRELISDDHAAGSAAISARLGERVIGQDDGCNACARVVARFKAGMNDPEKPCGNLFFVGPTGVGKTHLARTLARYLFGNSERMLRYDMSEYHLPGSGERLLAVGPGVSSLATELRREPLALVLFDEIEKAHPEVFDLLLGLLGEGRLSDVHGRLVDGRMAVIVMTSNLGVTRTGALGFGDAAAPEASFRQAVRRHFRPEFFNRLDEVVAFRNLALEDVERIVDLEVAEAARRTGLVRRAVRLEVSAAARQRLAERGWHPSRGARPLRRVIEEQVITPAAVRLAADPRLRDLTLRVVCEEEAEDVVPGADRIVLES